MLSLRFFPKNIQNISLDLGTLRDYPPMEFLHEGKMCLATRNKGGQNGTSVSA